MESFRFIHAARLLLDHQLHGTQLRGAGALQGTAALQATGAATETIRPLVEDATLLAFDRIVGECLRHQVDLLLMTGDTIVPGDNSVRGPGALIRGCERLAEQNILVVVAPGAEDPWEAWPSALRWPANVVRLMSDGPDEIPVLRDGRLLAVVSRDPAQVPIDAPRLLKLGVPHNEPFCIGVCDPAGIPHEFERPAASEQSQGPRHVDYRATGGGPSMRTVTVGRRFAHDPGPAQATGPLETGPRGCTLVSVDPTGKLRRKFLPTAPVRFEQLSLSLTPELSRDDLVLEMIGALDQLPRFESDRLWFVAWNVSGRGPCRELLDDASTRQQVLDSVAAEHGIQGVIVHSHDVRLRPPPADLKRHAEGASETCVSTGNDLVAAFERCLAARTAQPTWSLERCLADSSLGNGPWASTLEPLIAQLDKGDVALDVRQLGLQWLASAQERAP